MTRVLFSVLFFVVLVGSEVPRDLHNSLQFELGIADGTSIAQTSNDLNVFLQNICWNYWKSLRLSGPSNAFAWSSQRSFIIFSSMSKRMRWKSETSKSRILIIMTDAHWKLSSLV